MDIQIQKRQAHNFLGQENTPRKRFTRKTGKRPNARQVNDVVQECILKNCQISELFQQNIYSKEEEQWLFQGENSEEMGEDMTISLIGMPPRFFINELSSFPLNNRDYRYEYYNPCFLGYAGSYNINKESNSQLKSSDRSNRNKPACWTNGNHIAGNIFSEENECTFPEAASQPFQNEIYKEFDTFKNYYWNELTDDDIENRRAAVRKMKKHLYLDICGVENTAKESSMFSNMKFNYVRNRTMNVNVFKNAFPAVLVGNIQVRPLSGVNGIVDIPMTAWDNFPQLWRITFIFIMIIGFCILCLLCMICVPTRSARRNEEYEQELRNLN